MAAERSGDRRRRRGHYGVDAPHMLAVLVAVGIGSIVLAVVGAIRRSRLWTVVAAVAGLNALLSAFSTGIFLHTTLRGKFVVWWGEPLMANHRQREDRSDHAKAASNSTGGR